MRKEDNVIFTGVVEGITDEAVLRAVLRCVDAELGEVHGKRGKEDIRKRIIGYNKAAHYSPWIVLVDLDQEADCAPALRSNWIGETASQMVFRIAVRSIESWLMSDAERFAEYFRISHDLIPGDTDALEHPKQVLIDLARKSSSRQVREGMIPRPQGGRKVGRLYPSYLIEFAEGH